MDSKKNETSSQRVFDPSEKLSRHSVFVEQSEICHGCSGEHNSDYKCFSAQAICDWAQHDSHHAEITPPPMEMICSIQYLLFTETKYRLVS
jgi:hypothetical protein